MDRVEFIEALKLIEKEKGIDREIIFEAIEASLVSACKKNFGSGQNIKVVIDRESGDVDCRQCKSCGGQPERNFARSGAGA